MLSLPFFDLINTIFFNLMPSNTHHRKIETDADPLETSEWLDALVAVVETQGHERAHYIIEALIDKARRSGAHIPYEPNTAYINTIPARLETPSPGDAAIEHRIRALIRWNALVMVVRANRKSAELGGHIASFASAATLYDVGFNHFWRGDTETQRADMLFVQGHCAPGLYARALVEGQIDEELADRFRQEVDEGGLSSYPHPWLMPDFWQFPTVSMGLGPIQAIYQARFMKYLQNREMVEKSNRKVWCFCGDGEMDEPESKGALSVAGRENLDNLVFVVNCNLQRLDGPVRGNGKIIQELESDFRGAGWNVIKVIWGSYWDPLLSRDHTGLLQQRMEEAVDGEYQAFKAKDGAYTREHFFGKYPELKAMVANMSDRDIWRLNRGGHDPHKIYAAYHAAMEHTGQPTVILAKTVKGYGMGEAGEGQNITHQQKKLGEDDLLEFRDRFHIPLSDEEVAEAKYYVPALDSEERKYIQARRAELGGLSQSRQRGCKASFKIPKLELFKSQLESTGDRKISTTMAFVRILSALIRDKEVGKYVVPIVPDESRTFGMEGMFRQLGIYSPKGQLYKPEDADQLMYYREDIKGQVLQEGINEAGAMSSWMAAGTAYSNHGVSMVPFYIFYSMFGFQRIGDLAWAAGDLRTRGFLMGGTAGRTTLAGEGLQHQDGHSLILANTVPNCVSYDPTYAYEMAVIVQNGIERMFGNDESVYFYLTCMNENYQHPAMPKGAEKGILKGMYALESHKAKKGKATLQLLGSGTILNEVREAAQQLLTEYGIGSDIWSVTSFNELTREGQDVDRYNRLNPEKKAKQAYVSQCLEKAKGPVIAATDYMKQYSDQIRKWVPGRYEVLGTDGFGRSDTRAKLRSFFEVNVDHIVVTSLKALADEGDIDVKEVSKAIKERKIDATKPNPLGV
ncbi:MAG: pyruvate dehydrogenase E1 component [Saprospiraceae bacterium]